MDIINFDREAKKSININPLAPVHPFRLLITGRSGCGKTNVLLNLLTRYLYFDKCYLFAKEHDQEKYQMLRQFCEQLDLHRRETKLAEMRQILTSNQRNFTPDFERGIMEEMENFDKQNHSLVVRQDISQAEGMGALIDKKKQNMVVFDDQITARDQTPAQEAFVRFRHKNCSVMYLSQSYFRTPKLIRENCNYFIFFEVPTRRENIEIAKTFASWLPFAEFTALFEQATAQPFGFLTIDTLTKDEKLRLRSGFDGLLMRQHPLA